MPRPKSSGLPKAEEEQLRLTRLLDVATEVFFEMGYEAASTAEIAARAHSSKRALYSRFSSKEELFLAVIDYRTAKIADRVTVLFQDERPARPLLLEVAGELLRLLMSEEHTALMRLVYSQALQFPKAAQFMTERGPDRGIAKLAVHLKNQAARGKLSIPDPELAAQQFAGLLVGDMVHRAMLGQEIPHSQKQLATRAESTVDAFLKIYGTS
jgi:TetR/AcrR family transcriptional repressor of mexJK operon